MKLPNRLSLLFFLTIFGLTNIVHADIIASATNPATGLTYHLLTSDTWPASQAEAISLGGNLVTINDAAENQWVFETFTQIDGVYRDLWLGINDVDTEGNMIWISGEPVTFTNWQPGQPSNSGNVQDFGMMWAGPTGAHISGWIPGKWDDFKSPDNLGSSYTLRSGGTRTVHGLVELSFIAVDIDIKPGSDPNCFNLNGHGVIPVAVRSDETFDAAEIDIETLSFGGLDVRVRGNKGPLCSLEDASGDGLNDLVCQFQDNPEYWEAGEDEATLTGKLLDGAEIEGTDSICVVP